MFVCVSYALVFVDNHQRTAVKFLVENGANLNSADRLGTTPLAGAITRDRKEIVEFLTSRGASVDNPVDLKSGIAAMVEERDLVRRQHNS